MEQMLKGKFKQRTLAGPGRSPHGFLRKPDRWLKSLLVEIRFFAPAIDHNEITGLEREQA